MSEAETWNQDKEGWTNCYFNCKPNLATAAKALGGLEDPDHGGFVFKNVALAKKVAEPIRQKLNLPEDILNENSKRKARLKMLKDGLLALAIQLTQNN